MRIDNNLDGMLAAQMQVNQVARNVADVANTVGDPELKEVSQDLINSLVEQVPNVVAYEANAQGIQTQNEVSDMLLNIKA